jgi:CheY-like chemotaxis protein
VRPGATVLVVEDSEEVLALARENLLEMGYRVLTAADGREALEVLDRVGTASTSCSRTSSCRGRSTG